MHALELMSRLRLQADNVEKDGHLNAARYMRVAADALPTLRRQTIEECARVADGINYPGLGQASDYEKQAYDIRCNIAAAIRALHDGGSPGPAPDAAPTSIWRTIDSAPVNQHVLVFCPEAAEHTQIMICARMMFDGDPDEPEWWEINCEDRPDPIDVEPSHWMPLPAAPAKQERR